MKHLTRLFLFLLIVSACSPAAQSNMAASTQPAIEERQDFGYFLAWSPDDELLSVTTNTGLYVYDTDTFEQVAAFPDLSGSTVELSDQYMAAIDQDGMVVWDRKDFHLLFQEKQPTPSSSRASRSARTGNGWQAGNRNSSASGSYPMERRLPRFPAMGLFPIWHLQITIH